MNNDYAQEAIEFCESTDTIVTIKYIGQAYDPWKCGMNTWHDQYQATITRNGISHDVTFTQSVAGTRDGIEPNEYDILACLTKFEPGEYWDWCHEYGMENSKDSWDTWKACCEEWVKVCDLFGDVMGEFQMIA